MVVAVVVVAGNANVLAVVFVVSHPKVQYLRPGGVSFFQCQRTKTTQLDGVGGSVRIPAHFSGCCGFKVAPQRKADFSAPKQRLSSLNVLLALKVGPPRKAGFLVSKTVPAFSTHSAFS